MARASSSASSNAEARPEYSARHQALVSDADAEAARRRPNPVATVSSAGYDGDPRSAGFFDKQELTVQVDQEVELAGRRRLRSQAADAAAGASRSTLADRSRRLRFDVERSYFQLVLARLDAELARASLTEIDKVIAINQSRYRQGEVSGGELRRLEVERLKFSDDALQAELATRHARSSLLALLGAARLDQDIEPTDPLAGADAATSGAAPAAAASLTGQALATRPDVAASRQEQARALAEVALQRALRTPNVSVGAGIRRDFGRNGLVWGVTVPLPLLDRNAPGIARAEAERRLAESATRDRELAVALEVQMAADEVEISRQRLVTIERDYLVKAREARDAVLSAYRAGEGQLLDFLDAQRAYRDVQRAHTRALFDHRLSLSQLDAAVGARSEGLLP